MPGERYFIGPGLKEKLRETIYRVDEIVRVESGDGSPAVHQEMMRGGRRAGFKICTFTGSWFKGTEKTVTFKFKTTEPNTARATNLFADITSTSSNLRNCAIAKDGTAWFLIAAEC